MRRAVHAMFAAAMCLIFVGGSGVARSKPACRTVVVRGTDGNAVARKRVSISVRRCERVKVEFVFATQNPLVYLWRVTHKATATVLKLTSHGYGRSTSETGTQVWLYRAIKSGKTSVKFGDFTPSYPHRPAAQTFRLKVTVR